MNLAVNTIPDRPAFRSEPTPVPPRINGWQESLLRLLERMENGYRQMRSHADRVESVARDVATRLGLPGERMLCLQVAALLHDVGKIGLPPAIVDKPGRLTPREYDIVKTHAPRGERILREMGLPGPVSRFVRFHHEQVDGNGYPDGLRGGVSRIR